MTDGERFPEFIRALPEPEGALAAMHAWLLSGEQALAMFYEIPEPVEIPEHAHGAQWGVVLAGEMEFTIAGETRTYRKGDTYYVPEGAAHSVRLSAGYAGIDVFADARRYRPRRP